MRGQAIRRSGDAGVPGAAGVVGRLPGSMAGTDENEPDLDVLVDAMSARLGGGLSYLTGQLAALADQPGLRGTVLASPWNAEALRAAQPWPVIDTGVGDVARRYLWEQTRLPRLARDHDVVYFPANLGPLLPLATPSVLTLQDANYLQPKAWQRDHLRAAKRGKQRLVERSVAVVDEVVVISKALDDDFARAFPGIGTPRTLIHSAAPSWDEPAAEQAPNDPAGRPVVEPYVFAVGHDYAHKGYDALVAAWAEAFSGATGDPELVVAGSFSSERETALRTIAGAAGARLRLLGPVTDRGAMRWLYEHAEAFVSLSELEAYPLPPTEAGAVGCPIVLSDLPVHHEVAGDHATYVTLGDHRAAVDALRRVHQDPPAREPWSPGGTWDDNACALAVVLRRAAATRPIASRTAARGTAVGPEGVPLRTVRWITNIPAPYRNHRYRVANEVLPRHGLAYEVWYMAPSEHDRHWTFAPDDLDHPHRIWPGRHPVVAGTDMHLNPSLLLAAVRDPADITIVAGWASFTTLLLPWVLPRTRTVHLLESESNTASVSRRGLFDRARRACIERAQGYVVPADTAADLLVSLGADVEAKPLVRLANLVDGDVFAAARERRAAGPAATRAAAGLADVPDHHQVWVCPARLETFKGLDLLLPVLAGLPVTLVVAGTGSERDALEAQAVSAGVDARFLGQRSEAEIVDLYAAADLFVLPSRRDPNPLTPIEAMAAGLPVWLSVRAGNVDDVLGPATGDAATGDPAAGDAATEDADTEDAVTGGSDDRPTIPGTPVGWRFDPDDPAGMAARAAEIVALPPEERAARGEAAARRFAERFDSRRVLDAFAAGLAALPPPARGRR